MQLVFRDPGEFAKMPERGGDVGWIGWLARAVCQFPGGVQHRTDLGQGAERLGRPLRQIEALLIAEQPVRDAVELISAQHGDLRQPLARGGDLDPRQAEGCRALLVACQPILRPGDQRADQFIGRVQRIESRQFAAPQRLQHRDRRDLEIGEAMLPRKRVRTAWNGTGQR